ncbi:hypothetical protein [Methanohalophilus portucalensis]|uniref:hypothetical protein n=1 Tax=Methanohalophilus portucalensis TaxID=39664 RepID=UPI00117C7E63|nr:hypothetical protein [Methanohalophilus portucalensis]
MEFERMNLDQILDLCLVIINFILIFFIFLQFRDSRKPVILTGIISGDKEVTDQPSVLESGTLFFVIKNESNNVAKSLDVSYQFHFDAYSIEGKSTDNEISYLNPGEATKILLETSSIRNNNPDIFDNVIVGDTRKVIPKKTLKMNLTLQVRYNPIFIGFKNKIEDTYYIEWLSLENVPDFDQHPVFNCWNKRNENFYIFKTYGSAQKVELTENPADNITENF